MSAVNRYTIGTRVRLTATFRDLDDVLTAGTVVCKVKDPSGNITTVSNSTASTGIYTADVDVDEQGTWVYRFSATGAIVAAGEHSFIAQPSEFD
jgi:hypothetical protein